MSEFADTGKGMTFLGVIAVILGILAMLAPGLTGVSVTFLIGILVIAGGIIRMIWSFKMGSFGKGVLMFGIGLLTLVCGIALVANPLFASGVMAIVLAIYFIADGIFEISGSFLLRPVSGWGWMLFGGIVSIVLGIMIWRQFPLSGAWAIGTLLGIKLFFIGIFIITTGTAVKALSKS